MVCLKCGATNDENSKFCFSCGTELQNCSTDATSTVVYKNDVSESPAVPLNPTASTTPTSSEKSNVNPQIMPTATITKNQNENAFSQNKNVSQTSSLPPKPHGNPGNTFINSELCGEHISVAGWLWRLFLLLIPFIGPVIFVVLLFVWAFGNTPKKSLRTWARASLIFLLFIAVLFAIVCIFMAIAGLTLSQILGYTFFW